MGTVPRLLSLVLLACGLSSAPCGSMAQGPRDGSATLSTPVVSVHGHRAVSQLRLSNEGSEAEAGSGIGLPSCHGPEISAGLLVAGTSCFSAILSYAGTVTLTYRATAPPHHS